MPLPEISVIIPSKNDLPHLKECLPSLLAAAESYPSRIEIIVVDDHSDDETLSFLSHHFPKIKTVVNSGQGISSGRNCGVALSSSPWLCFLDNDVFVEKDFFTKAAAWLKPELFCLACSGYEAYPPAGQARKQLDGIKLLRWKRGFMRFTDNILNIQLKPSLQYLSFGVQGAYFFCSREKFLQLGGFDTLYDPCQLEESDLAYAGLKRGWKILYAFNIKNRHKCGSTLQSKQNLFSQYMARKNRILFVWKHIHDKRLFCWHLLWLLLNPSPRLWRDCWKMRKEIAKKRKKEKTEAVLGDRDLLLISKRYQRMITRREQEL